MNGFCSVPVLAVDLLELPVGPLDGAVGEEEGRDDVHGPALEVLHGLFFWGRIRWGKQGCADRREKHMMWILR